MGDRWMDERDREWRDRDWRRSEQYNRDGQARGAGEGRSWSGSADDDRGRYDDRGRVERERSYGRGGRDYDAPSRLAYGGAASGEGRGYGRDASESYGARQRFESQDYVGPGQAQRRGYTGLGDYNTWERDGDRSYNRDLERRYMDEMRRPASGGTGGYDYERGYGDGGRGHEPNRPMFEEARRDERGGGGDFLQRAGERISSWFRGGGHEDEGRDERRMYERDHRGAGPRSYRRSDERISDDVHQRLTDDPYLDASNINVEVKDREITLSGSVDNREAKHRAERLVEDVPGVTHVQNNLRVDTGASLTGSGGRGYGSSALEAEMRRNALETDPNNNGVSGLSGRTSTGAQAERSTRTSRTDSESGGV